MRFSPRPASVSTRRILALALSAGAALGGCHAVGPNYEPPLLDVPDAWASAGSTVDGASVNLHAWWTRLNDATLTTLMQRAVAGNLDLQLAAARVREARAARTFAAAGDAPVVDSTGGYTRSRNSENSGNGLATSSDGRNLFTAGLDAGWEIDVFGGVRRAVEAADADIASSEWERRNVLVSLLAEVALSYVDLRTAQQRIVATRGNVDTQSKTVDLSESRFKSGLDSEVDAARARSERASTASLIPALESQARQAAYRLSVLTGQHPGRLLDELEPIGPIPILADTDPSIHLGVPTDLLRRRPDLRRAERDLAAQTARIGVATADLYPRFTLGGSIGLSTQYAKNWIEGDSLFWSIGPGVRWNLFDGGAIRANIAVNEARTEQVLINYQSTLLNALREVDSAAVAFVKNQERVARLSEAVQAQQRAVELSNSLFSKQLTNFLTVLDSQRRLFELQDQLVASQGDVATSMVSLYKALGGGWEATEQAQESPPSMPLTPATPSPAQQLPPN